MWEILYPAALLGFGFWSVYRSHRSLRVNGQAAALACGLRVEETSGFWSPGLIFRASAGPIQVRISDPRRRGYGPQLEVVAPWPLGFSAIKIRPELEKPPGAREVEIGDDAFDNAFYIVGPVRLLLALLDAKTRRLMIAANAGQSLQIAGGELRAEVHYPQMTSIVRLLLERTRAILLQALRRRRLQTARACLERLGDSAAAEDVETLVKVMAREKSELAATAVQALGATGSPAAEPPLIASLQHERTDVRVAAAKALGRAGSTAAVLPLKEAAEHTHDQDLRRATRQSIAEIQSRLQGASPGQLSLAGAEVGQLSLAQAEAGQLSFAIDPAGQLSLDSEETE